MSVFNKEKTSDWFGIYTSAVSNAREAGFMLHKMMMEFHDCKGDAEKIEEYEHKGDEILHNFFTQLQHAFITPFDRDVMSDIIRSIDNIMDNIEHVSKALYVLNIKEIRPDALLICEKINEIIASLLEAMMEFKHYKKSKRLSEMIIAINRIESEGDEIYANTIFKLVREEKDALYIMMWKEIYEIMENVLDSCEDVADYMETITASVD